MSRRHSYRLDRDLLRRLLLALYEKAKSNEYLFLKNREAVGVIITCVPATTLGRWNVALRLHGRLVTERYIAVGQVAGANGSALTMKACEEINVPRPESLPPSPMMGPRGGGRRKAKNQPQGFGFLEREHPLYRVIVKLPMEDRRFLLSNAFCEAIEEHLEHGGFAPVDIADPDSFRSAIAVRNRNISAILALFSEEEAAFLLSRAYLTYLRGYHLRHGEV